MENLHNPIEDLRAEIGATDGTGCIGADSYRRFARDNGFTRIETLCWGSSAGDWQFIVSKDGFEWYVLDQQNNYPLPGFTHTLDTEPYYGTADAVLEQIYEEIAS